jgi:ribosomal protein L44E
MIYFDENVLLCPICKDLHTHIDRVSFGMRKEDEAVKAITVDASRATIAVDGEPTREHSSRRHWVALHVDCEGCGETSVLVLSQHKGLTLVSVIDDE